MWFEEMRWSYSNLTLQIEPTRKCNLNCNICIRQNLVGDNFSLSFDNFKKILDSGSFRYVGLHGWGEPLLNPEVSNMVEYAEKQGFYTNLTTNGTLIRKNIDKIFSSGLREIAFGVYHKENLSYILPQIEDLISEKNKKGFKTPKIYMDITVYKETINRIPDLMKIASELGVDAVILHRLFNVYKGGASFDYISVEEEKNLFVKVKKTARRLKIKLFLPEKHSLPCNAVRHCIFITAEGKVTPCCYLPEFFIGDAFNESICEIMHSAKYINFLKNMREHPICSKCFW